MTGSERDTLKGVIDAAKRARLRRAGDPDLERLWDQHEHERKVQPRLRPAAEQATEGGDHGHDIPVTAPSASLALMMAVELLGERTPARTFQQCIYCGWPSVGRACRRHRDLLQAERDMYEGAA